MFEFIDVKVVLVASLIMIFLGLVSVLIVSIISKGMVKKEKMRMQDNDLQETFDTSSIVHIKIRMAQERMSNHEYIMLKDKSIYDKLSTGTVSVDEYIVSHKYKIDDICKKVF